MANYNRLKDAIITVIKTNGNNEITGVLLQQVLLAMIGSLGTGYQFAGVLTSETILGQSDKRLFYIAPPGEYDNNFVVPGGCLGIVYGSAEWEMVVLNILAVVDDLVTGGTNAALSAEQGKVLKTMLEEAVANITALIPSQASSQNQLADKAFVNSSIATNTANYISDNGQPFQSLTDLLAYSGILTNNDYAFVVGTDANGNTTYTRYKYSARTDEWAAEYVLNNSSFTAAQWAAISSGITAALVQKLSELPVEVVTYTAQTLTAAQKQQAQANLGLQSVLKYTEQTLTDEQKLQALANLGLQNVLRYVEQSLTDEQKAQARTNIGATAPEVFWAEYGSTTAAEIDAAVAAGKAVMARYGGNDYLLSRYGNTQSYYYFGNILGSSFNWLRLQVSNNTWAAGVQGAEVVTNKSQSVEADKTSTAKYPSTKAVADAITAGKQIFWATYGETSYADVVAAATSGKLVVALYSGRQYILSETDVLDSAWFVADMGTSIRRIRCTNTDQWTDDTVYVEITNNRSQSIETDKTSTTKYPSTKAVADALAGKQNVIDSEHKLDYSLIANTPDIPTEVFPVTYGTTTQSEILAAVAAGKLPVCKYGDNLYVYAGESSTEYSQFTSVLYDTAYRIFVKDSAWGKGNYSIYSKPDGGIPASDLAAGVIPAVPTDIVKYTAQTLTDSQKAQARTNIGAEREILRVTAGYEQDGETISADKTYDEISAAIADGKDVVVDALMLGFMKFRYVGYFFVIYFACWFDAKMYVLSVSDNEGTDKWRLSAYNPEFTNNKVTTISSSSSDKQYPSAKAVYTELAKKQPTIDANHKLDYSLLSNTPTIPAAQVNADWNANSGVAEILNKPTIPSTYAGSPTAGGFANKAVAIPFGNVDADSTATDIKATVDNFPAVLAPGVCAYIRNDVIASANGWTLNINGTGALPVYQTLADATRTSTIFSAASTHLFIYNPTRVKGGCWDLFYGYNSNENTIGYNLRTNTMSLPVTSACYRYRLLFTSADGTHFVPANASTSTNATTKRTTTQTKIDPFGSIRYYSSTSAVSSGARPGATSLWEQYLVTLGYSFNRTGAALTLTAWKPVYIKCTPQADGSAIIEAETPYVQDLPTEPDGKIYIFLGVATSAAQVEVVFHHPVYYNDGTGVRLWTGIGIDSTPTQNSKNLVTSGGIYDAIQNAGGSGGTIPELKRYTNGLNRNAYFVLSEVEQAIANDTFFIYTEDSLFGKTIESRLCVVSIAIGIRVFATFSTGDGESITLQQCYVTYNYETGEPISLLYRGKTYNYNSSNQRFEYTETS